MYNPFTLSVVSHSPSPFVASAVLHCGDVTVMPSMSQTNESFPDETFLLVPSLRRRVAEFSGLVRFEIIGYKYSGIFIRGICKDKAVTLTARAVLIPV